MKKLFYILIISALSVTSLHAEDAAELVRKYSEMRDFLKASEYIEQSAKENPKNDVLFVVYGDIYYELDQLNKALEMYKKADDLDRNESWILRKIARTQADLGKTNEALETIEDALDEDEDDPFNHLTLGLIYVKADSLQQASLILSRVVKKDNTIPEAHLALGDLYFKQKVYDRARQYYEQALELNKNLVDARIKLATSYYWLANTESDRKLADEYFNQSLKSWNEVSKLDPLNAKAFFQQGKIFFLAKRYVEAAKAFHKYVELRPDGSLGRWFMAQSFVEGNECDSAKRHLRIVMAEIDSVRDKAKLYLTRCLYYTKEYTEANAFFKEIHNSDTLNVSDLQLYAQSLFRSRDTLAAFEVFAEVIERDPSNCSVASWLASQYVIRKEFASAVKYFGHVLNNCEQSAKINYYMGYSYFFSEKPDTALLYLEKSWELDSTNLQTLLYIGDALAALDRLDSAKVVFSDVVTRAKSDTSEKSAEFVGRGYQKLCSESFEAKQFNELSDIAKEWADYDPKEELAWLYVAVGEQGSGNIEGACRNYRRVLSINPKNETARKNLNRLNCN